MTQADFYILGEQTLEARDHFTCRLVDKAVRHGRNVFVHVDNKQHAQHFDELLWVFRPESFIPHEVQHPDSKVDGCPVHIGWTTPTNEQHDIIINTSHRLPEFFGRFSRLMEVVVQEDAILKYTREHYRFLHNRGYAIQHQDMRVVA